MKSNENDYINICDFNLPNHDKELSDIDGFIDALKDKIKSAIDNNKLTNALHDELFEETMKVLLFVGDLSSSAFNINDDLEELYKMKFISCPVLGKTLWLEQYNKIHHPYTLRKNRCYSLIELLDEGYIKKFKTNPPNWEI